MLTSMSELITGKPKWTVLMHRLFNSQKGGKLSEMKWILIGSFVISKIYHGFLDYLNASYMEKELPENVKDVYDYDTYQKWMRYTKECRRTALMESAISSILVLIFLACNVYSGIFNMFEGSSTYLSYFLTLAFFTLITLPVSIPFSYHNTFVIEEKYGMNKTTKKTFFLDVLKETLIGIALSYGVLVLVMVLFERFGNTGILWITVAIILISLILSLLIMPIMRIFNKFTPLEDSELKSELLNLCGKYRVEIKRIVVMDASRRTTKANAFCTGLTRKKTISLDDNLVENYSTEQIVAVFAHEFAHARYKHVLRSLPFGILRTVIVILTLGLILNSEAVFSAFGFSGINYFFAFQALPLVNWWLEELLDIISNKISRQHEYQADAFAAKEGYGNALIDALKKLHRDSLSDLNPHPLIVILEYSHPTLSQRIKAISE